MSSNSSSSRSGSSAALAAQQHSFSHLVSYDVSAPEFLKRLQCADATEGELASLSCQVIGEPVPQIEWFKEDGSLILDTNVRYEMSYSVETAVAQLIINCALMSDEMSYKCVATNKYGTSKTIGVLVVKANKALRSPTKSVPVPTPQSPLRNIDVPYSPLHTVKEETEISSSQSEDAADTLLTKLAASLPAQVVNEAASNEPAKEQCRIVTEPPSQSEFKEGEDIKICCNILGLPEPEIIWYKDDMPLRDDHRVDIYSDRGARHLEICDALLSDAGVYTIVARNGLNQVHAASRVIVAANPQKLQRPNIEGLFHYGTRQETYRPPQFIVKPTNQAVHEGKRLIVSFKVSGVPKPEVAWFRDGKPLRVDADDRRYRIYDKDDNSLFEIDNVSILDTGEYTCTASNVMGAVYSAVNIIVEAMTEPETCSEVYSDLERSATQESDLSSRCKSMSDSNSNTDISAASLFLSEKRNKEIVDQLMEKRVREHIYRRLSSSGGLMSDAEKEILLREYVLRRDYTDEQREISLCQDDRVEILDISKPEKWLVRTKYKNLNQVCYIPPELLEPVSSNSNNAAQATSDTAQDSNVKSAPPLPDDYQRQFSRVKSQPSALRRAETVETQQQQQPSTQQLSSTASNCSTANATGSGGADATMSGGALMVSTAATNPELGVIYTKSAKAALALEQQHVVASADQSETLVAMMQTDNSENANNANVEQVPASATPAATAYDQVVPITVISDKQDN